eukprot:g7645.t1
MLSWNSSSSAHDLTTGINSSRDPLTVKPYQPQRLPKLEHTCTECFPLCVGDGCLIKLQVMYPKVSKETSVSTPYPVAIFSGGFLVKANEYVSYAEKLASWGYVSILYDKVETIMEPLDDVVSIDLVREIIDWTQSNPLMRKLANSHSVYLIGHSRGGKVSVLAALDDSRVKSLCLIDPVDNTVYAPLGPRYPSAIAGVKSKHFDTPMMIIGSELGSDCAPVEANYRQFFNAARGPAMEVTIRDSGHFQFLDSHSSFVRALCLEGPTTDEEVRIITQSSMIAWGEATMKGTEEVRVSASDYSLRKNSHRFLNNTSALHDIGLPKETEQVYVKRKNFKLGRNL